MSYQLVSYVGSVAVTINKFDLFSGGKKITAIFIATSGNNGTDESYIYIAHLNKMSEVTSDVVDAYAQW